MSFGEKTPGKLIWGTSNYRIQLHLDELIFSNESSGKLSLYERRWIKGEEEFTSLEELVSGLRAMWEASLRQGVIQDARLARWLEEYLAELGVKVNYLNVLAAIKGDSAGKFKHVTPQEILNTLGTEKKLEKEEIEQILPVSPEITSTGVKMDVESEKVSPVKDEVFATLTEKHRTERPETIKSMIKFVGNDGSDKQINQEGTLAYKLSSDKIKYISKFINNTGEPMKELVLEDSLPFDLALVQTSSTSNATKNDQRKDKEALNVSWRIEELKPGESVEITYHLQLRLRRMIIAKLKDTIIVLQTFDNIITQDGEPSVLTEFTNNFDSDLEDLTIVDQLPKNYSIESSNPELKPPLGLLNTTEEFQEVTWTFTDLKPGGKLEIKYFLREKNFVEREISQVKLDEDVSIDIVKLVKKLKYQSGIGIIIGVRTSHAIEDQIRLKLKFPMSVSVQLIDQTNGDLVLEDGENCKIVGWELDVNSRRDNFAFIRVKSETSLEESGISCEVHGKTYDKHTLIQTQVKEEGLVLPVEYQKSVDVKA